MVVVFARGYVSGTVLRMTEENNLREKRVGSKIHEVPLRIRFRLGVDRSDERFRSDGRLRLDARSSALERAARSILPEIWKVTKISKTNELVERQKKLSRVAGGKVIVVVHNRGK
jgi:hypothetical protein